MPRTGLTPDEIREKAIDATMVKIRSVGFEKVRLSDIAKQLGVSHSALYSHFKDKSDLLDAVSERWLLKLDETLEAICRKKKDPCEKIHSWALAIHRAKVEKVRSDPELYRTFDLATEERKSFVKLHLNSMQRQMCGLVKEVIAKKRRKNLNVEKIAKIITTSLTGFHHPKLVVQHIDEKREILMNEVIQAVLEGLDLV